MASPAWTFGERCQPSAGADHWTLAKHSNVNANCYFAPSPLPVSVSQRDSVTQPKVGAQRLPWVSAPTIPLPQRGCVIGIKICLTL